MNQLNLDIGPVTLGLVFEEDHYVQYFQNYFSCPLSSQSPDIFLDISFTDRGRIAEVPNSLFLTKKSKGNKFQTGHGLIKGKWNRTKDRWSLKVHKKIIEGDYKRVFEQILYQAYNSASRKCDATLVHSSGVIKEGEGYLFVGPSEAGKSTVAKLSQEYHVINDEINIVNLSEDIPMLESSPFNGLYKEKKPGKAPIKGIFILNQATFHGAERISGGKAIRPLAKEIIPPIGLEEKLESMTFMKMMDRAKHISTKVPIYRMDFLPDSGFWEVLSSL